MIRTIFGVIFVATVYFQTDEHMKWFTLIFALLLMVWDGLDTARSNIIENQAIINRKAQDILDSQFEMEKRLKKLEENIK